MNNLYYQLPKKLIIKLYFGFILSFLGFCANTYGQNIEVRLQNNGCQIATYEFEVTGSLPAGADNIDWRFGNLNVSTNQPTNGKPSASYNSSGTYFITAEIQNSSSVTLQTLTKKIYVYRNSSPEFSANSEVECYPLTVEFTDLTDVSNVLVGDIVERKWVFGDGNTMIFTTASTVQPNLNSFQTAVTHTYNNVGDFQVTLVLKTKSAISSGAGIPTCTGTLVKEKYIKVRHPITPKASYSVSSCDENGFNITFENESSFPSLPPPSPQTEDYEWRYYEGGVGSASIYYYTTIKNKSDYTRLFDVVGTHDIVLKAETKDGCETFTTVSVTIPDNSLTITPSASPVCQDQELIFAGEKSYQAMR